MLELVFESLLIGNSEEPSTGYGLLAEDVEVAPDGLSATFRIRKEARFSDGSAVMAADVVHSFNTLMSKQASPQFKTIFGDIKEVRALAERLVKFEFASSNRELPLVAGSVPVFSRKWGLESPSMQSSQMCPLPRGPTGPPVGNWGAILPMFVTRITGVLPCRCARVSTTLIASPTNSISMTPAGLKGSKRVNMT